jgi:hypothetical protein
MDARGIGQQVCVARVADGCFMWVSCNSAATHSEMRSDFRTAEDAIADARRKYPECTIVPAHPNLIPVAARSNRK